MQSLVSKVWKSKTKRAARMVHTMENAMRIFTEFIYGYLPAAGEMVWPVLKPNYDIWHTNI